MKWPSLMPVISCVFCCVCICGCTKHPYTPITPWSPPTQDSTERLIVLDTISNVHSDRNDVASPPVEWLAMRPDTAWTDCGRNFFDHLRMIYPLGQDTIYGNNLYGLIDEPAIFANAINHSIGISMFFNVHIQEAGQLLGGGCPRMRVDRDYVEHYLGPPTNTVYNSVRKTTRYTYRVKSRWRMGPCPFFTILDVPEDIRHDEVFFQYCGYRLRLTFDESGELIKALYL